jgi:origin recognition complex subunit 5
MEILHVASSRSSILLPCTQYDSYYMLLFALLTCQTHLPSPPFANVHGLTATGKSSILRAYFPLAQLPYAFINVRECITTRHLLERIVAASLDALEEVHDENIDRRLYARTENLSALCVNLQKMLEGRSKFVLVLDAIDKLREGGGTLIPALGRLGEAVRSTLLFLNAHANWITRHRISPS